MQTVRKYKDLNLEDGLQIFRTYFFQGSYAVVKRKPKTMTFNWQKLSPDEFHQLQEYISCK